MYALARFVFGNRVHKTTHSKATRRRWSRLDLEALENRFVLSTTTYSVDGTGNNLTHPTVGSAGTDLIRISPVAYADGISALSLATDQSARVISDLLNNQADPTNPTEDLNTVDQNNLSDFGYAWGQFLDHDMDLTTTNSGEFLSILADPNDPSAMGDQTFERSTYDTTTGTSKSNPRQQTNSVTSYLDLSQVYGSNAAIADALRTHSGGLLKTSAGNMLPYDNSTYFTAAQLAVINMANDSGAVGTQNLFVTGDVRGNENIELTVLQTLFVRNHNLIAKELQKEHPGWTDEQLYQEARKLNIAEYQEITYNQYLPDLLGAKALSKYTGYKPNVDPAIATEFSTIAFRFGHSLLSSEIERQGNNGLDAVTTDSAGSSISLAADFFDPNVLNPAGVVDPLTGHVSTDIGVILKAEADGDSQADDLMSVSDIRDLLFANGGLTDNGQDLIARDIERARDDGIGTYNQVRVAYGLAPVTSFAQITSDVQVQKELQAAYGTVDKIDPFEGGLAENHVPGSDMGPLFTRILADQFSRLRDGDRLFYLNQNFSADELNIIQQGNTLAKVIEANTSITNLQPDVFLFKASISGSVSTAAAGSGTKNSGPRGLSGVTVQLKDSTGNLIATTTTDGQGRYRFNQQNGVSATGNYNVSIVLPTGDTQTSANPPTILISRGGIDVAGINFLVNTRSTHTVNEHGTHAFQVAQAAPGKQADSMASGAVTGSAGTAVQAAPEAASFVVLAAPQAAVGAATNALIEVLDAAGRESANFRGTISFNSSDTTTGAASPKNGAATSLATFSNTFTSGDDGSQMFYHTFDTPGVETLTTTGSPLAFDVH